MWQSIIKICYEVFYQNFSMNMNDVNVEFIAELVCHYLSMAVNCDKVNFEYLLLDYVTLFYVLFCIHIHPYFKIIKKPMFSFFRQSISHYYNN